MKAIRCKDHKACLHHVDAPQGEGIRIKVASAGICGSDLHMLAMGFPIPFTLGHEIAGFTPNGTPVAIEPLAYCGHCEFCARGDYNLCTRGGEMVIGVGSDGGMAEELIVPEHCLVPLPASVSAKDACLVEPLSVAVHGLARVALGHNDRIAVIGGGTIGLCAVAIARLASQHVDLAARHAAQKEAGEKLGASLNVTGDYDLVIDCAGTSDSIAEAVRLCKPGATLLLLATYWGGLTLPAFEVGMKQLKIITSSSQARSGLTRDVDIAASALAKNPAIASTLITHRFPLEAVEEAFAVANDRASGAIKVTFNP